VTRGPHFCHRLTDSPYAQQCPHHAPAPCTPHVMVPPYTHCCGARQNRSLSPDHCMGQECLLLLLGFHDSATALQSLPAGCTSSDTSQWQQRLHHQAAVAQSQPLQCMWSCQRPASASSCWQQVAHTQLHTAWPSPAPAIAVAAAGARREDTGLYVCVENGCFDSRSAVACSKGRNPGWAWCCVHAQRVPLPAPTLPPPWSCGGAPGRHAALDAASNGFDSVLPTEQQLGM
jgi:hypothetical protein